MKINIVVAIASNNAIGKENKLLWHLPNDLKHFKEVTSGRSIIMGRKTFDSIGRPLPKRRNIIITRQSIEIPGCEVVSSLTEAIELCKSEDEVFIGGGAQIYEQALPITQKIYLTIVHQAFEADTFFPQLDPSVWSETAREDHEADDRNPIPYSFITLERR